MHQLQESFDAEASDVIKHPSEYARNFLEYCCFRALALSTEVTGYLDDKNFRRLTFNMMIAWEFPSASSQPLVNVCLSFCVFIHVRLHLFALLYLSLFDIII